MNKIDDYKQLFESLPERYVVFDADSPNFTMLAASSGYLEVTGKKLSQIIGQRLFDVFPDVSDLAAKNGKGELQISLEKVIRTKQPDSTGVIRYDLADETGELQLRYWQATHYPLIKDGVCTAILQSTADVTELVLSSEQLKLANIKLDDALAAGLVGSWSWDIVKDSVTADKGMAEIFGIPADVALNGLPLQTFVDTIHTDDRERVSGKISHAVETGDEFEEEYRTVDSLGGVHWVIARGKLERDEHGAAIHFPGVMIDITSRKETEAELQASEERLRFMADTMPQLVWITRPDGYHEYYNRHWYEYTGTTHGETDGEGWNNLFHPDDRANAWKIWRRSLKTGEPYEIKYRLYHAPSDSYRWVIGRALPHKDARGTILKWYGTCTDIDDSITELEHRKKLEAELKEERDKLEARVAERTSQLKLTNEGLRDEIKKRQRAEKKLRRYSEELQRSNRELEEFAYVSSHDLQEPLRKIQSFSDLLVEEYADKLGDGDQYLSRIQGSAKRMSKLIEDLLTFSRVTTKQATKTNVDLNQVLEFVINDLDDRIKREGGQVTVTGFLPTVRADETHMRQLFQNIVSNALKFHAKDSSPIVTISAASVDGVHQITIKDNGIGIDEKYLEKIFAVFQRLNVRQAYEGTGIGLAVCKKIVERYGGTIEVESKVGEGTAFTIKLPAESEVI